jgi:hypothetical protein
VNRQDCNPQEAEIRKIVVQCQPRQIVHETLSGKKPITKKDWWSGSSSSPSTTKKKIITEYEVKRAKF